MMLADSEIAWTKLIPFGIFVLIWVFSAFASVVKKAREQSRLRSQQARIVPTPLQTRSRPGDSRAGPSAQRRPRQVVLTPQARMRPQIDRGQPAIVQQALALAQMFGTPRPPPAPRPPQLPRRTPAVAAASVVENPLPVANVSAIEARTAKAMRASDARASESSEGTEGSVAHETGPKVTAWALSAWLRPPTLRDQFILTEIFQPPLALRRRTENLE